MAKMIRALLMLGSVLVTNASNGGHCALNGALVVDEMLDSAVFIWASVKRCGQPGAELQCTVDVASAVESVNGMINVIVDVLQRCGDLDSQTQKAQCGTAASALTQNVAGLTASSGSVIATCHVPGLSPTSEDTLPDTLDDASTYGHTKFGKESYGKCVVDVKNSFKHFFGAIKSMMAISDQCKNGNCVANSLNLVATLAEMGSWIAGAISSCSAAGNEKADCASASMALVSDLNNVAQASMTLSKSCSLDANERLYLEENDSDFAPASNGNSMTLALVAFLPIAAVLGFVGGSRFAKARAPAPTCEVEALMEAPPADE